MRMSQHLKHGNRPPEDTRRETRHKLLGVGMALTILMSWPAPTSAQVGKVLAESAKFIGTQLLGYGTGKILDKALGLDCQTQLKEVEASILAQLRKGTGDVQQLRAELAVTRSQLSILQTLIKSKPNAEEVEHLKRRLEQGLAQLTAAQHQQGQRLSSLEVKSEDHEARLRRLEAQESTPLPPQVADSDREALPGSRRKATTSGSDEVFTKDEGVPVQDEVEKKTSDRGTRFNRDVPELGGELKDEKSSPPRRSKRNTGVTLIAHVTGQFNEIAVRETASAEVANIGFHNIEGRHQRYMLWLLVDTGGVITIESDGNAVLLPSYLCGRVRVILKGRNNRKICS